MFVSKQLLLAAGCWLCAVPATVEARADSPRALVFEDEFDGAKGDPPNISSWTVAHNRTHGDLEQQLYIRTAVALDGDGNLVLVTARAPSNVTGPDGRRQYVRNNRCGCIANKILL
jgi:hypothetical protein